MVRHSKKTKKKRFGKLKALFKQEEKRLTFLGTLDYDDVSSFDDEDEYESDDEEYEDAEEDLSSEIMDFGI